VDTSIRIKGLDFSLDFLSVLVSEYVLLCTHSLVLEVRELQEDVFQRGLGDAKVDNLQLLLHGEDGSEDVRKRRPACT
jgi:hypothetical protein